MGKFDEWYEEQLAQRKKATEKKTEDVVEQQQFNSFEEFAATEYMKQGKKDEAIEALRSRKPTSYLPKMTQEQQENDEIFHALDRYNKAYDPAKDSEAIERTNPFVNNYRGMTQAEADKFDLLQQINPLKAMEYYDQVIKQNKSQRSAAESGFMKRNLASAGAQAKLGLMLLSEHAIKDITGMNTENSYWQSELEAVNSYIESAKSTNENAGKLQSLIGEAMISSGSTGLAIAGEMIAPGFGYALIGAMSAGFGLEEAESEGQTGARKWLFGSLSGLGEAVIEASGGWAAAKAVKPAMPLLTNNLKTNLMRLLGRYAKGSAQEGMEELYGGVLNGLLKWMIYDKAQQAQMQFPDYFDPKQTGKEVGMGALGGALLGGIAIPTSVRQAFKSSGSIENRFMAQMVNAMTLPPSYPSAKMAINLFNEDSIVTNDDLDIFAEMIQTDITKYNEEIEKGKYNDEILMNRIRDREEQYRLQENQTVVGEDLGIIPPSAKVEGTEFAATQPKLPKKQKTGMDTVTTKKITENVTGKYKDSKGNTVTTGKNVSEVVKTIKSQTEQVAEKAKAQAAKAKTEEKVEPVTAAEETGLWSITSEEYAKDHINPITVRAKSETSPHKEIVRKAMNEGKTIPEAVLNEYPDIKETYYKKKNAPHRMSDRTKDNVTVTETKPYHVENPQMKSFYVKAAEQMLDSIRGGTKGVRDKQTNYFTGEEVNNSTKRKQMKAVEELLDESKVTYETITDALERITTGKGNLNTATVKRIEIKLHDMLYNGFEDTDGLKIEADENYRKLFDSTENQGTQAKTAQTKAVEKTERPAAEKMDDIKGYLEKLGFNTEDIEIRPPKQKKGYSYEVAIAEVIKALGSDVMFYKGKGLPAGMYYGGKTLFISESYPSATAMAHSVAHEFMHMIEFQHPSLYADLAEFMKQNVTYEQMSKYLADYFEGNEIETDIVEKYVSDLSQDQDAVISEMIADEFANYFMTENFWTRLANYSVKTFESLARRMIEFMDKLLPFKRKSTDIQTYMTSKAVEELHDKFFNVMLKVQYEAERESIENGDQLAFAMNQLQFAMRGWHGSPYDFLKFTTNAIGTGEGAQIYGWGLYFASQRSVAEWYKKKFDNPNVTFVDVKDGSEYKIEDFKNNLNFWTYQYINRVVNETFGDFTMLEKMIDKDLAYVQQNLSRWKAKLSFEQQYHGGTVDEETLKNISHYEKSVKDWEDKYNKIKNVPNEINDFLSKFEVKKYGKAKLYEVDINVEFADMLYWDSSLSYNTKKAMDAYKEFEKYNLDSGYTDISTGENEKYEIDLYTEQFEKFTYRISEDINASGKTIFVVERYRNNHYSDRVGFDFSVDEAKELIVEDWDYRKNMTENKIILGEHFYQAVENYLRFSQGLRWQDAPRAASEWFAERGVKGIMYADGATRHGENRTYNYVVFEDDLVDIVAKFSMRSYEKDLVAVHNITEGKLDKALRLGGLPVPSIAIIPDDTVFSDFGTISFIGSKDIIDPQIDKKNEVYNTDIYSKRMPRVEVEVNAKQFNEFRTTFAKDFTEVGMTPDSALSDLKLAKEGDLWSLSRSVGLRNAFLKKIGQPVEIKREFRLKVIDEETARKILKDHPDFYSFSYADHEPIFRQYFLDMTTRQFKDKALTDPMSVTYEEFSKKVYAHKFDPSGETLTVSAFYEIVNDIISVARDESYVTTGTQNDINDAIQEHRKEYEDYVDEIINSFEDKRYFSYWSEKAEKYIRKPYTAENAYKYMKGKQLNAENNFNIGSAATAKAAAPVKFKSIDEMHQYESTLAGYDAFYEYKTALENVVEEVNEALDEFETLYGEANFWETIAAYLTGKSINKALEEGGYDPSILPSDLKNDIIDIANRIKNSPVKYYEAKPQRIVKFEEFAAAIVYEDVPKHIIQKIQESGVEKIIYYDGTDESWLSALKEVEEIPGVKFSMRKEAVSEPEPPKSFYGRVSLSRRAVKQRYFEEENVGETILKARNWKDIKRFFMNWNIPERVFESIMGSDAKAMIDQYIKPIKRSTAAMYKWANKIRNDVRELDIDRKKNIKGVAERLNLEQKKVTESSILQMYGEGMFVDADNNLRHYGYKQLEIDVPDPAQRRKILHANKVMRQLYDDMLNMVNEVLTRNGYDPVERRENYFVHMEVVGKMLDAMGIDFSNDTLPSDIIGLTKDFEPGRPWFRHMLRRAGIKTDYDAIRGIDSYINSAGRLIFQTDNIQRLRTLITALRHEYGQKNLQRTVTAYSDSKKSILSSGQRTLNKALEDAMEGDEALNAALEESAKDLLEMRGRHLSNFIAYLDDYTDRLAGKTTELDRVVSEKEFGRTSMAFFKFLNKQVTRHSLSYNIAPALTQFIPLTHALATINKTSMLKSLIDTTTAMVSGDENFRQMSDFLVNRDGSDPMYENLYDYISNRGMILSKVVDKFVSEVIVRAKYYELTANGVNGFAAMEEANDATARMMADRSMGAMPLGFESTLWSIFAKYQIEPLNNVIWMKEVIVKNKNGELDQYRTLDRIFKSMAGDDEKLMAVYGLIIGLEKVAEALLLGYLFNNLYEMITGRRPAIDPVGIIVRAYELNLDPSVSKEQVIRFAAREFADQMPFSSIITGGRVPINNMIPNIWGVIDQSADFKTEASKLMQWALPAGTAQFRKTYSGVRANLMPVPGKYTEDYNLQFITGDSLPAKFRSMLFGVNSAPEASEFFDKGRSTLTEKQTLSVVNAKDSKMAYQETVEGKAENKYESVGQRAASDFENLQSGISYLGSLKHPTSKERNLLSAAKSAEVEVKALIAQRDALSLTIKDERELALKIRNINVRISNKIDGLLKKIMETKVK